MLDFALDNRVILNDVFDCAIQELDMLFNTTNTELINKPEYGTNFEQFLWQLTPSVDHMRQYIQEKIGSTYFLSQYEVDIDIETEPGETREIYRVEIVVTDNKSNKNTAPQARRVFMLT